MRRLFVDASFWIALTLRSDGNHRAATGLARELDGAALVTTELVLAETLNGLAGGGPAARHAGAVLVDRLQNSERHEIVEQSHELFERALTLYRSRSDQHWGLIDCASFVVMRDRGVSQALSFDRDFEQAGFAILPSPR